MRCTSYTGICSLSEILRAPATPPTRRRVHSPSPAMRITVTSEKLVCGST
ncbi:Uncharacterised protein [Mycobacteroides abscessus subsp. abscessus]|nr:Uncharacterised protein [Mycobacteroides abscessus subsp. abscessus]